ncbi:type II toxin-antitoxin system MqsR family toxin [Verminephrobacter eiseniae]|uniref:type II toxin-antitoxin system MqsR family toxin n=1 Tax=Verminephrobacter eiseniae TaxID=364317 RepID=UPI0022374038|nr:type II toxin-antitoxin system MqsR family toxin [Verminephrobacter eiseniae]MCW5238069.1 hypothetical protein [Verminephrobacter eiseniae]
MVINYSGAYWRVDPVSIPGVGAKKRVSREIFGGPLIKLEAVQALLRSGEFDADQLWLATEKCERDLRKESWSINDVLQMLVGMDGAADYYKSEWCEVLGERFVPCDVYRTPYDAERKCRHSKGLLVYIKFSIEVDGALTIALVSCHAA